MARPFKIFLGILGTLLVLVVGVAVAVPLLFDPNDHRAEIEKAVQKETGRSLKLGNLELKLFPWLAVAAQNVELGNAPGFGDVPFAKLGEARVGVKLMPLLLDSKVEVSTLSVSGLALNLARDKSGKTNWDDLTEEKPKDPQASEPKAESSFRIEDVDIGGVDIRDAQLSFDDQQAGARYELLHLRLATGALRYGEPFDLDAGFDARASQPAAEATVGLSGRIDADIPGGLYAVENLKLSLAAAGKKLLAGEDAKLDATLTGALKANLAEEIAVKGLTLDFNGGSASTQAKGQLSGDVSLDPKTQRAKVTGLRLNLQPALKDLTADVQLSGELAADLNTLVIALGNLKLDAEAKGKAIPNGAQKASATGELRFDAKAGSMHLAKAQVSAAGLALNTDLRGEGLLGDAPKLSGPLNIAAFNPRELMSQFGITPPATSDAKVLKSMSLSADYSGGFTSAQLSNVLLKLDETTARGSINVRDFATQAVQFALTVDQLDADRYLAPKSDAPAAAKEKSSGSVNDIPIPAEVLNDLNAQGTLKVGLLKINGLKLADAEVALKGGRGQVKTQDISAKLYGGTINLSNTLTPGTKPTYAAKTSLTALNTAPFLTDFLGKDYASGVGSVGLNLTSGGLTVGDLRKALNGDVNFKLENGAVKGFNLAQILRKAQATLSGNLNYTEDAPKQTDFSTISGSANIVNGILKSDALNAASPLFRFVGNGEINLVDETINYLAKPTIVESSKGEGGAGLDQLKGLIIPIKLSGSLLSPSYKIDLKEAFKQKALGNLTGKADEFKTEKKEELKAKEDEAKDKLKQKLNDKLNKLFGGKKKEEPAQPAPATEPAPAAQPAPAAEEPPKS